MADNIQNLFALDLNKGLARGVGAGGALSGLRGVLNACCDWADSCCDWADNGCRNFYNPPHCPGYSNYLVGSDGATRKFAEPFRNAIKKIAGGALPSPLPA
jgi:hypothetical protein